MAFDVVIEPASGNIEITGSSLTFIGEKSGSLFQIQQSQNTNLLVAGDISASGTIFGNQFYQDTNAAYLVPANISQSFWVTSSAENTLYRNIGNVAIGVTTAPKPSPVIIKSGGEL